MKALKWFGVSIAVFLVGREIVGLLQWFVIEDKTWSEFKALTIGEVRDELRHEGEFYAKAARRTVRRA